jgi:hypothetical protein
MQQMVWKPDRRVRGHRRRKPRSRVTPAARRGRDRQENRASAPTAWHTKPSSSSERRRTASGWYSRSCRMVVPCWSVFGGAHQWLHTRLERGWGGLIAGGGGWAWMAWLAAPADTGRGPHARGRRQRRRARRRSAESRSSSAMRYTSIWPTWREGGQPARQENLYGCRGSTHVRHWQMPSH